MPTTPLPPGTLGRTLDDARRLSTQIYNACYIADAARSEMGPIYLRDVEKLIEQLEVCLIRLRNLQVSIYE